MARETKANTFAFVSRAGRFASARTALAERFAPACSGAVCSAPLQSPAEGLKPSASEQNENQKRTKMISKLELKINVEASY